MAGSEFWYRMPRKGVWARARLEYPEMVVLKGSVIADRAVESMPERYRSLRERLIGDGTIQSSEGRLVFTRDCRFSTSSEAVCIVEGGSRNGYLSWRDGEG